MVPQGCRSVQGRTKLGMGLPTPRLGADLRGEGVAAAQGTTVVGRVAWGKLASAPGKQRVIGVRPGSVGRVPGLRTGGCLWG